MDADADAGGTRMWHGLGASTVMLQMSAPLTTHSWHHGKPCLTLQHSVPADRRAVPTCPHTPPPSPALPALGEAEQNFNFNVHRACKGKKKNQFNNLSLQTAPGGCWANAAHRTSASPCAALCHCGARVGWGCVGCTWCIGCMGCTGLHGMNTMHGMHGVAWGAWAA